MQPETTAPLFPLPNVLLYPDAMLPLHVFEPRYVSMVKDLERSGERGIVLGLLQPDWEDSYFDSPAIYTLAGYGKVSQIAQLNNGRYNILVQGLSRVNVVRELSVTTPYRRVQVVPLLETPIAEPAEDARLRAALQEALINFADGSLMLDRRSPASYLADVLLIALPIDMEEKHGLFSILDVRKRAEAVLEAAHSMNSTRRQWEDASRDGDKASWN